MNWKPIVAALGIAGLIGATVYFTGHKKTKLSRHNILRYTARGIYTAKELGEIRKSFPPIIT